MTMVPEGDGYTHNAAVLAYRMENVEGHVQSINNKLDSFVKHYPSTETIALILRPIEDDLRDVRRELDSLHKQREDERKEKDRQRQEENKTKRSEQVQLKFIFLAAAISPIASILIGMVIYK